MIDGTKDFTNVTKINTELPASVKLPIGPQEVIEASQTLYRYRSDKARLDAKIVANEEFWKLRQYGARIKTGNEKTEDIEAQEKRPTAWLWAQILGRYSDAMDSYPTCNIKPRQQDDIDTAKKLSAIIPVILKMNDYEDTYSKLSWYTLKHGGGIQGIFWNPKLHNGLGDISIKKIDILNFFCESGIDDIQDSENVFVTELVSKKKLEQMYPQTKGRLDTGSVLEAQRYLYDDNVSTADKAVVVDWYYKVERGGRTVLHYVKYVGDIVLESTENNPQMYPNGLYDHGKYPFVPQVLYPAENGSVFGYGMIDIGADTQLDIDDLNFAIKESAKENALGRYAVREGSGINLDDLADRKKRFVSCTGSPSEAISILETRPLAPICVNYLQMKQDEIKYISSNQDTNNGGVTGGVTAASGIASLQEKAGKNSRSSNREFYRAYVEVIGFVIELIRQFYDVPRQFRIAPDVSGEDDRYITFDNSQIKNQQIIGADGVYMGLRAPEFDVDVTAETASPYKKAEMNELALNFYAQGFFAPQMADQALACLDIMDFEHKDLVVNKIQQNQTLQQKLLQYQSIALQLAQQSDPVLADQLAQTMMADSQTPATQGGTLIDLNGSDANGVEKARNIAQESTRL